jgi:Transposase DDE domain group 1
MGDRNGAGMGDPSGEADRGALRLDFNRRLRLQFRGSAITSDAGLLAYRELDDTLGLTGTGADTLADARTGKNGRHRLAGLLRQSIFGRLAGYEDVNDAERLCRDPTMRWVVGDHGPSQFARSACPCLEKRTFTHGRRGSRRDAGSGSCRLANRQA